MEADDRTKYLSIFYLALILPTDQRAIKMTDEPLPNDDLGEWGESEFRALCAAGSMVANKAERDRMGWDFLIELPPDDASITVPLDQRPNALRCRVQVKTHWQREDGRVEVKLSAAQRLALDLGPSFIVVLTAASEKDGNPRLVGCHLIHMLDDNLERVLRRLRQSAADPAGKSINEQTITYTPKGSGEELPLAGRAIRGALLRVCGPDPQKYMESKGDQIRNLGYTSGKYRLQTTIKVNDTDEFVEMMLGLRPISVERLDTYDVRFDVPLRINDIPEGATYDLQYAPNPVSGCAIRVRGAGLRPPAVFQGEVFLPGVQVPKEFMRILVKAPFVTLDLRSGASIDFRLDGKSLFQSMLSIEDWQHYLRLVAILGESELEIDVEPDDRRWPNSTVKLKNANSMPQEPWVSYLANVARCGEGLLKLAGARGKYTTIDELYSGAERVLAAHADLCGSEGASLRDFQSSGSLPPGTSVAEVEFLYADCVAIAGVALAYACRMTMRPEVAGSGLLWRQVAAKPEKLLVFDGSEKAFELFVTQMKEETGLKSAMVRRLPVENNSSTVRKSKPLDEPDIP